MYVSNNVPVKYMVGMYLHMQVLSYADGAIKELE